MKLNRLIPAFLCAAGMGLALSPVETYGPLSIKGNKLVDSSGTALTLRGMSLFWHYHQGGKEFWLPSTVKWAMTDWHAAVIRAPIGVDDVVNGTTHLYGAISDPSTADTYITRVIEAAILNGFYIIVDWHTEQIHTAEAKAFFGDLAKRYGNTPNIIWELYNEPNGPGWGQIATYANAVIPEIRKYSKNVILVGNSSFDQHPDEAGTELDKYTNIAYTVHFYSDHAFWGTVSAAMAKGHAVFSSEFGLSGSSGDGGFCPINSGNIGTWISDLNTWGVSHVNWSLGNAKGGAGTGTNSETAAALNQGVSFTGGWATTDLTASGQAIRAYLISKNPAWTISDNSLKVTSAMKITSATQTNFVMNTDSIQFSSSYNQSVAWSMVETGQTSGATYSSNGTGTTVAVQHLVGKKDRLSGAFQLGETVDVLLQPGSQKLSYVISKSAGVLEKVRETQIHWQGTRLYLADNLLSEGTPLQVGLRDAQGKLTFSASAVMGSYGRVDLNAARPKSGSLQVLEITTDDVVLRSRLAPNF